MIFLSVVYKIVLIFAVDGLNGFTEAIQAIYPKAEIQRCIVHQIRSSLRFVSWKDRKAVAKDLKSVYAAYNEEDAQIESLNATIKRKTKSKGSFPTVESAFKVMYLATQEQQAKWNMSSIRNCFEIYPQLSIFFSEIMSKYTK